MSQALVTNRIAKRNQLLQNWEYYLSESVYHRTFSNEMKANKKVLLVFTEDRGRCKII